MNEIDDRELDRWITREPDYGDERCLLCKKHDDECVCPFCDTCLETKRQAEMASHDICFKCYKEKQKLKR